ncbi:hypothetical protein [Rhodoferax ferrireducens]|uniref:hypothetical protein n=1 Tax=Rhodoferax ferrireducens TaxID=192843 RepID=UPI000E0D0595|nr:hypothetical protein [Rhodoferax ferrireducens]
MNELYLFALANAALCACVLMISVCRLNGMHGSVLLRVRSEYAGYIGAAVLSALQPWWGEWPQWGSVGMASALLLGLLCSSHAWHGDRAPAVATDRGDLRNMDGSAI